MKHQKVWRGGLAVIAVGLSVALASSSIIFTRTSLDGSWNVITAYATGVGIGGQISLQDTTPPFGGRVSGTDDVIFDNGVVVTGGQDNFNTFFRSYFIFPSGAFEAAGNNATLAARLRDTRPIDRVAGLVTDTSANAAFFGLRLFASGTDDLFVGTKHWPHATSLAFGQAGQDSFVGAILRRRIGDTAAEQRTLRIGRAGNNGSDSASMQQFFPGFGTPTFQQAGPLGVNAGRIVFDPDIASTFSAHGSAGHFDDTGVRYRLHFTADSNLVVIAQDTLATTPLARHKQVVGFAVRRRSPLNPRDLFGPWQVGGIIADSGVFNGVLGFFEFRGNGTGLFDNGAPPPRRFVSACTYIVASDNAAGAHDSFIRLFFRPDSAAPLTEARVYLSADTGFIAISSNSPSIRFIGLGAKRANTIERKFSFGVQDTPLSQTGHKVGMRVDTGASTGGQPTFAFSQTDTSQPQISAFKDYRDTAIINLGIDTVLGAIDIIPDTTVNPDSIIITIDITGSTDSQGGTNLIPMVYESGVWVRIGEESVTARGTGFVSFKAPHFSGFGLGNGSSSSSSAGAGGGGCVIENVFGRAPLAGIFPNLREMRDAILVSPLGRIFVAGYYSAAMLILLGAGVVLLVRKR